MVTDNRRSQSTLFTGIVVKSWEVPWIRGADGDSIADNIMYRSEDLLQLKSGGHVMGFMPQRMYIVGMGYSLIEAFERTKGVTPIRGAEGQVGYPDLWPGISLNYEIRGKGIGESIYRIEPGANVQNIRLAHNCAVTVAEDGSLQFAHSTEQGRFTMTPPRGWQDRDGNNVAVAVSYVQHDDQTIGFKIDTYDKTQPLIIDPLYQWHSFYGSPSFDLNSSIAVDGNGNVYVAGVSDASWNSNTGSTWSLSPKHAHSSGPDIVILKLNSSVDYQWHTFYGSETEDTGGYTSIASSCITVDENENIYISGSSDATWNGPKGIHPRNAHSGRFDIIALYDIVAFKLNCNGNYICHTF